LLQDQTASAAFNPDNIVPAEPTTAPTNADAANTTEPGLAVQRLADNISRVFIGKEDVVRRAVLALVSGGHVLIEDVPGLGKTLLAKAIARSLHADFKRVQFTADLLPSDISGVTIYSPETQEFKFRRGPIFTNVLLADEINRATPRTQSALLETMEESSVTVDGERHQLAEPFFVLATQNPVELEGTYPLPFAQMDRFIVRLSIGYLDRDNEIRLLREQRAGDPLEAIEAALNCDDLVRAQEAARGVRIEDSLLGYIVDIIRATREADQLEFGASPRGSLDLQRYAQAIAFLDGRDFVLPDDIKESARVTLPHRLITRKGTRSVSVAAGDVIDQILEKIAVPI
jgi:MoxR-like ATPase